MSKIIKHGRTYNKVETSSDQEILGLGQCIRCGCVFAFEEKDIKLGPMGFRVRCPECNLVQVPRRMERIVNYD